MPKPSDQPAAPGPHRITCPQCKAQYVPSRPTQGRRVRCRHCGHVWRDEGRAADQIAAGLARAAASWSAMGSTVVPAGEHASTMAQVVSGMVTATSPPPGEWVGRTLGRYEVKAVLGHGAMGHVYEGFDRELKRTVALKVLPRRIEAGRESLGLKYFLQEARIAARLNHPNAVTIYEVGFDQGIYFLALEHVRGQTLSQVIEQVGPLPARQACYVIAAAARALAAGHALGIIHRDVKPGNIMIDTAGHVKVTDFGLAAMEGVESITDTAAKPLGTPGWISPEAARGQKVTPASDIYGLGLTLHYALTKQRLISAESRSGMIAQQRQARSIRREQLPAGWPRRLRDIVVQCLQADPADRYQSAETLAADLLTILTPDPNDKTLSLSGTGKTPEARRVPPVIGWIALGLLVVVAALAALTLLN